MKKDPPSQIFFVPAVKVPEIMPPFRIFTQKKSESNENRTPIGFDFINFLAKIARYIPVLRKNKKKFQKFLFGLKLPENFAFDKKLKKPKKKNFGFFFWIFHVLTGIYLDKMVKIKTYRGTVFA